MGGAVVPYLSSVAMMSCFLGFFFGEASTIPLLVTIERGFVDDIYGAVGFDNVNDAVAVTALLSILKVVVLVLSVADVILRIEWLIGLGDSDFLSQMTWFGLSIREGGISVLGLENLSFSLG
jgi:hypothetical protein